MSPDIELPNLYGVFQERQQSYFLIKHKTVAHRKWESNQASITEKAMKFEVQELFPNNVVRHLISCVRIKMLCVRKIMR